MSEPLWIKNSTPIEKQLEDQNNEEMFWIKNSTLLSQVYKPEDSDMGTEKDLLDFVGAKEANGNYNAYYGNAKNNEVNFTTMTYDDVLAWQDKFVSEGSPSSAVGKYQFLRKTLRDLKRTEGLKGDELFNEELQDRLATSLLKRRGLDKFRQGTITAETFANNLAKEWASLPMVSGPKRGLSYYAGDGLNKALTDVDPYLNIVTMLGQDNEID